MMEIDAIKELMEAMNREGMSRLSIKKGEEFELEIEGPRGAPISPPVCAPHSLPPFPPQAQDPLFHKEEQGEKEQEGTLITSPMVGTFYAASSPEAAPFVKVGDSVSGESVLGIIEAMKVMNELKAGCSGVVAEIYIESGKPVEFGSRLFRIV